MSWKNTTEQSYNSDPSDILPGISRDRKPGLELDDLHRRGEDDHGDVGVSAIAPSSGDDRSPLFRRSACQPPRLQSGARRSRPGGPHFLPDSADVMRQAATRPDL